jgi:C4-dicarboxylate transporter, DctM subunit
MMMPRAGASPRAPFSDIWRGLSRGWGTAERATAIIVLVAMTVIPLSESVTRALGRPGIPGAIVLVQHLTLWVALVGAAIAAGADRLLALSTPLFLPPRSRAAIQIVTSTIAVAITASLCVASVDFVRVVREAGNVAAWGIPAWAILAVLPVGFASIAMRILWRATDKPRGRYIAAAGIVLPLIFLVASPSVASVVVIASIGTIVVATCCGMPIFAAIGGAALVLLWAQGVPANSVPGETYRLTTSPMLPAIPLFALAGYILSEGEASRRLTRLFKALVGWLPGGLAIVVTAVLAFFTPLTGASGVTIVALGGVLLPVLGKARYPGPTSLGLVTVSGSIGLLFFPSLPVFLYGFYANQPYERLFIGGLLPGILLVLVVAGWAALRGSLAGAARSPFDAREAVAAISEARWELALPLVVVGGIVLGWATLVEAAAVTVLYTFVVECGVHRSLHVTRDIPRLMLECVTLVGGFLIILSVALGFTNYLILAEVPTQLLEWVRGNVQSPVVFLLALNVLLVIVGALMDIYSAIVIVVPLVTPIAAAYGIDPIHLGVIFLANMELGYLMPPMGENLFLSSYRFNRPLTEVYRSTLPYTLMLAGAVLIITYVPGLTLWLVRLHDAS